MWWSQTDSVITLCMLGSVLLLARGNVMAAWAVWTVGFLFKPQPIVILPVLAGFTYWRFGGISLARGVAAGAATFGAAVAPWALHGDARGIAQAYDRMFEQWPLDLAQGAWNGWSIMDARAGDPSPYDVVFTVAGYDVDYALLSLGLCGIATGVVLAFLRTRLDLSGLLFAAAAMVFTFYIVPTSTHERYLYPAFALAAPLLVRWPALLAPFALLSGTFFLNLLAINPPNDNAAWEWHGTDFAVGVAGLHTALYTAMLVAMLAVAVRAAPRSLGWFLARARLAAADG
jgi:Gpi18-like mannosyltransferase